MDDHDPDPPDRQDGRPTGSACQGPARARGPRKLRAGDPRASCAKRTEGQRNSSPDRLGEGTHGPTRCGAGVGGRVRGRWPRAVSCARPAMSGAALFTMSGTGGERCPETSFPFEGADSPARDRDARSQPRPPRRVRLAPDAVPCPLRGGRRREDARPFGARRLPEEFPFATARDGFGTCLDEPAGVLAAGREAPARQRRESRVPPPFASGPSDPAGPRSRSRGSGARSLPSPCRGTAPSIRCWC